MSRKLRRRRTPKDTTARSRRAVAPPAFGALALMLVLAAVVWWWRPFEGGVSDPRPARPDLLLVTIDTLRADRVGSNGHGEALTPVLDELAASGVRFPNAVAHVPLTLPSHASILTGLTPLLHGVRDNARFVLRKGTPTLAAWLGSAGYRTAAFVSAFPLHGRFGLAQGFEVYDDRFPRGEDAARPAYIERRADRTVEAVIEWLGGQAEDAAPAFVWVHLFDPHAPYEAPEPFASRFAGGYDGEVAFSDQQVGALLSRWRAVRGHDPIVLVTSDHGEGLGEHGEPTHGLFIYDSTVRVPFIVAGPGIPAGRVPPTLARGIDVAPTLLDLAGVELPREVEGRSLVPAWKAEHNIHEEPAYIESQFGRLSFGWAPLHGWRAGNLMYISAPTPELYDVGSDPEQLRNLAPGRRAEAARFERILQSATAADVRVAPASPTRETSERMGGLGYVTGPPVARPSLRDPKELAKVAVRIENAMAIERSDPDKAARELRSVLEADPANPLARRHLAVALSAAGRFEEAVREVRLLVASGDTSEETLVFLGDALRLAGRPGEALASLEETVRSSDGSAPDVFNAQGKALLALGRPMEAAAAFERARAAAPGDAEAMIGLTDSALARGDLPAALRWLQSARDRDPEDPSTALKLGVVLVRLGQVEQALPLLRFAADRQPRNADALLALGGALAKTGQPGQAAGYFERAIRENPSASPATWNGLAMALLESGDRPGAVHALRESLRLRPDQPDIREMLRRLADNR